jgi:nucleoside-diphosphate-sugar epimerase
MSMLMDALRAGHAPTRRSAGPGRRVMLVGGAGPLGSALLEELLAARLHAQVSVLVTQPLQAGMRGLRTVVWDERDLSPLEDATAVVVFDRERDVNGRELAFYRPKPESLTTLAAHLHERGVRHLLVVMPHTQALLPDALKRGLASLDEEAVARLGFEHFMLVRTAQAPLRETHSNAGQRLAHWMLSQLQLMVPQRERPAQARKVAQFAACLAAGLAASPPGTRVVPPEVVWDASQARDAAPAAQRWLDGA